MRCRRMLPPRWWRGFKPTGGYKISVRWTPQEALAYMDRQGIACCDPAPQAAPHDLLGLTSNDWEA